MFFEDSAGDQDDRFVAVESANLLGVQIGQVVSLRVA